MKEQTKEDLLQEIEIFKKRVAELENLSRLSDVGTVVATIAHELKNPLHVIKLAVYNIKKNSKDDKILKYLNDIDKKVGESDQIIRNLLSYSQIKQPSYEYVLLKDILDNCISYLKEKYSGWDVKFKVDCKLDYIRADSLQMSELFSNIIDNAYQSFYLKKGEVKITGKTDKEKGNAIIVVEDDGAGIEKADLAKIFTTFFTTRPRGIGLGLPVCKQIVSLHRGSIGIDSSKGKGTAVTVVLPLKEKL